MILKELIFLVVTVTIAASAPSFDSDDPPALAWPAKYKVSGEKISLHSGVTERVEAWKHQNKSRVDYNDGVVKTIVDISSSTKLRFHFQPELDYAEDVENKCYQYESDDDYDEDDDDDSEFKLQIIVPDVDKSDYDYQGTETINGKNTFKFTYDDFDSKSKTKNTMWVEASVDSKNKSIWIPVRFEKIKYKTWYGAEEDHDIWNFYDFALNYNESVFEVDTTDCEYGTADLAAKHLHFLNPDIPQHVDKAFSMFKLKHNKQYADEEEHSMRRGLFHQSLKRVVARNRQNKGYKLTINKFADMTAEEKTRHMGYVRGNEKEKGTFNFPYSDIEIETIAETIPKEYDLRVLGYVTPVKNQLSCGCCWSFGSTAAAEGALARSNGGRLIHLSNQALIDCAWPYGAHGCNGGSDTEAFKWMIDHGLPTEEEYGSYTNKDGICKIANMTKIYPIKGFSDVPAHSNSALKIALINHGPLSVSIHATDDFISYSGGIFYDYGCSLDPKKLNHEISLVGYGEIDGAGFWIIKNSWGPEWGIEGYGHVSIDRPCGITTEPTFVVL